jgi:sulfur-oxidizing protein SoxY
MPTIKSILPTQFSASGSQTLEISEKQVMSIDISVPKIAENGAIVPITVRSKILDTERIFVFAEKNPQPLVSDYIITKGVEPFVASRIKMSETAFVHVIVLAKGTFYRAARQVKVTIGGCGEE